MASSSASPPFEAPPSEPQSYTKMDPDKDIDTIGAHCNYQWCHQYDFLPFRCESCKGRFCSIHRTESAHECTHAGEWAAARRKANASAAATIGSQKTTQLTNQKCSDPSCKTSIHTLSAVGVHCQSCNRDYCLKHRLREDHDCVHLIPIGARRPSAHEQGLTQVKTALGRLRVWGKEKQAAVLPKPKPSTAASRTVAVNALKRTAKGDDKIDLEKRIYLHVEAEASSTTSKLPKGEFYYNKEWSVGKVLDVAARALAVQNVNNHAVGEEQKLRIFHVEGGRVLGFAERVGQCVQTGNTIVLLRGVGAEA